MAATGALAKDPSTTDVSRLNTRLSYLSRVRPNDPEISKLKQRISTAQKGALGTDPSGAVASTNPNVDPNSYQGIQNSANQGVNNTFQQINSQGAFNPGDFSSLQDEAEQRAMGSFNRTYEPQFQKQEQDWRQRMAEQGIDPNSERAKYEYQQMQTSQNNARQGAADSAFQQGLGAQQQAFTQAYNQYQMPYQNLGAYAPFMQQQFTGQENALDRQQQTRNLTQQGQQALQQIRATPHSGSIGLAGQLQLQNNAARNALINNSLLYGTNPNQGVNSGNGFAGGIGAGVGAMLGAALR